MSLELYYLAPVLVLLTIIVIDPNVATWLHLKIEHLGVQAQLQVWKIRFWADIRLLRHFGRMKYMNTAKKLLEEQKRGSIE